MPDLASVLDALYSGGDVTIFQAVVDTVGQGVVTLHANGGTFTDVPYLDQMTAGAPFPSIGDQVYVVGRKNWGMLCIGRAAPGPTRSLSDPVVNTWSPYTQGVYDYGTQKWSTPGDGLLVSKPGEAASSSAVFFFRQSDMPALPGTAYSAGAFWLDVLTFPLTDGSGMAFDSTYVEIGLTRNSAPSGSALTKMANLNQIYQVTRGESQYVSIPIDWVARLVSQDALGIYVAAADAYPVTLRGPGTARITNL